MMTMQNTEKQNALEQTKPSQAKTAFHFVKTCSNSANLQQTNQGHTGVWKKPENFKNSSFSRLQTKKTLS